MCLLQLVGLVAVGTMLLTGSFREHLIIFWSLIVVDLLAMLFWDVIRRGWHIQYGKIKYSQRYGVVVEFLGSGLAVVALILAIIGIVLSFV